MGVFSRPLEPSGTVRERPRRGLMVHFDPPASVGAGFEPVLGVSLELFANIAQAVAARNDDFAHGTLLAAACGIPPSDWRIAASTWNARITSDPAVGLRLSELCRAQIA
jgi:hypothetical protein